PLPSIPVESRRSRRTATQSAVEGFGSSIQRVQGREELYFDSVRHSGRSSARFRSRQRRTTSADGRATHSYRRRPQISEEVRNSLAELAQCDRQGNREVKTCPSSEIVCQSVTI